MPNLKHAIKQALVALKAKNIQPIFQTVGNSGLLRARPRS